MNKELESEVVNIAMIDFVVTHKLLLTMPLKEQKVSPYINLNETFIR